MNARDTQATIEALRYAMKAPRLAGKYKAAIEYAILLVQQDQAVTDTRAATCTDGFSTSHHWIEASAGWTCLRCGIVAPDTKPID